MVRAGSSAALSVERFFQFSLLGLVASGYLAVAGSGYLDAPTVMLTAAGLLLRGLLIYGFVQFELSERTSTLITIGYTGFYVVDYFLLSREFLQATVHLVFFLAVLKILTAKTNRDHLYTACIAFLELLAAAILSANFNFFVFLALYLLFAIAALSSGEIRRSMYKTTPTARNGPKHFQVRLASLTILVTMGILALTGGLFFLLPRTADAAFSRLTSHHVHIPGFSNQVNLGDIGEIKTTSRPAMHIRLIGREIAGGVKWRGGTLVDFDGHRWSNPNPSRQLIQVVNGQAELEAPDNRPRGISYTVDYDELETDSLFFAGTPQRVYLHSGPVIRWEGGYRLGRLPSPGFHYEAYSLLDEPPEVAPIRFPTPILSLADRERNLQLPILDARIARLAREVTAGASTDLERARILERYLRTEFGYTLQLPSHEVADPVAYFLFTRKKGHCEYFASSLALMLRTLGIPSRLATGFQSGIFNPISDLWLLRASDAHSWVEAWIPGHGWTTFDPTPPDPNAAGFAFLTKLGLYVDAAETFWQQWVVGYTSGQQLSLVDQLQQGARRLGIRWFDSLNGVGSNWGTGALVQWAKRFALRILAVFAVGLWIWKMGPPLIRLLRIRHRVKRVRRGEASIADATLLYERMLHLLKRRGYHKPVWFTPVEFAASLPQSNLGKAVTEFTATYNALRFGGRTDEAPRLSILLDQLERLEPGR
ncbi:MAG TPA: transglutaminaseTgpA domain-containing protein [Bryobacteraceae bacterium]|nr:transglutaminaseTgpA domain-containing protein [Bryobacteraceae bacterium]